MSFLQAKLVENAKGTTLNVLGTLAQELPNWKTARIAASGYAMNLFRGEGATAQMATVVFSKNLSKAIANGDITIAQLKHCQIINGANANGEQRYYLVVPAEFSAGMDCAAWLAQQVEAPVRKTYALNTPAAATAMAI